VIKRLALRAALSPITQSPGLHYQILGGHAEHAVMARKPESAGLLCFIDSMTLACPVRTRRANDRSAIRPPGPVVSWGWK